MQAKLHVALDLGDSTGDAGYSLGKGPPATGVKPDNSIEMSRSVTDAHKHTAPSNTANGTTKEDSSLQHSAAQVAFCGPCGFAASCCAPSFFPVRITCLHGHGIGAPATRAHAWQTTKRVLSTCRAGKAVTLQEETAGARDIVGP